MTTTYKHKEAFCLMLYRDSQGNEEIIWNSRDGVTPFIVTSKQGYEAQHVEWRKDKFAPDHKPQPGDRIFTDGTPKIIAKSAKDYVAKYWNDARCPMSIAFAPSTQDEVVEHFAQEWLKDLSQPCLVTVE